MSTSHADPGHPASAVPVDAQVAELQARIAQLQAELDEAHRTAQARAAAQAQIELDLRAQRALLRTVVDESPDIVILKDHNAKFLLINKNLAQMYGTTPDAVVGKDDGDFTATPEQNEFFRQNVLGIMARGETEIVYEEATDEATGETRYFKSIKKPFLGENGKPQILVIAHDITDIRVAQKQVAEQEKRLRYVLDATGEGVWDWDLVTNKLEHNQTWYDLLGYGADEMTGTMEDFQRSIIDEEREGIFAAVALCLQGQQPYRHEHRMRRKDGTTIWVLDRGDVVERGPDGRPLRMVGSFADITPAKTAKEALEQVNVNLEHVVAERTEALRSANVTLNKALTRLQATQQELVSREKLAALGGLVAGIAHEINTPVGVAVTASSLWQDKVRELASAFGMGTMKRSDLQAFLDISLQLGEVVSTNLGRASTLVRDFKQVAVRQSSDAVEEFGLLEALQTAVTSLGPEWRREQLQVDVRGDASVRLKAAPGFVFQVASNLIVNAARHAYPAGVGGQVTFSVDRIGHEACLRYVDHGIGMAPEVLDHIFEPFFTTQRGAGGSGLGLHIVWNLITGQLGGRIEVASEPGRGVVMTFYLPCLPTEMTGATVSQALPPVPNFRITANADVGSVKSKEVP